LDSTSDPTVRRGNASVHGPRFSKIFRWRSLDPHAPTPATVELVGSLTDWRVMPMTRDAVTDTWQLPLHGIPGNRTHRYMLLVDGEPAHDRNCDGLAVPQSKEEQQ